MATCWDGHLAFFSKPQISMGCEVLSCLKFKSDHMKDVTCVDINVNNNIATASNENLICFWNSFTAKLIKKIRVPD